MSILAAQAASATCSVPWCDGHIPSDAGLVHISAERTVIATAGGPTERTSFYVSVERLDQDAPAVRLAASGDPLTPQEAFELGAALQAAAFAAASSEQVTR